MLSWREKLRELWLRWRKLPFLLSMRSPAAEERNRSLHESVRLRIRDLEKRRVADGSVAGADRLHLCDRDPFALPGSFSFPDPRKSSSVGTGRNRRRWRSESRDGAAVDTGGCDRYGRCPETF